MEVAITAADMAGSSGGAVCNLCSHHSAAAAAMALEEAQRGTELREYCRCIVANGATDSVLGCCGRDGHLGEVAQAKEGGAQHPALLGGTIRFPRSSGPPRKKDIRALAVFNSPYRPPVGWPPTPRRPAGMVTGYLPSSARPDDVGREPASRPPVRVEAEAVIVH